jgi:hypothetical protein
MKPDPVIAIAGSRKLDRGLAPRLLVRFLAGIPPASTIVLRRGIYTAPNGFELQVAEICGLMGLVYVWMSPEITGTKAGREAVFARDLRMIDEADLILCFYTEEQAENDESGTQALAMKAMEHDRIVYAYAIDYEPVTVRRIGENDPDNEWGELVPTP